MSPKMLPHKIVSNCLGQRISCIAALSTYMWLSLMESWEVTKWQGMKKIKRA